MLKREESNRRIRYSRVRIVASLESVSLASFPETAPRRTSNVSASAASVQARVDAKKKAPRISRALLFRAEAALINYNKVRIARVDDAFRIYKAIHVNRDPTAVGPAQTQNRKF